jgi:predicted Zn-dependent protease
MKIHLSLLSLILAATPAALAQNQTQQDPPQQQPSATQSQPAAQAQQDQSSDDQSPSSDKQKKIKHDGGKSDVDAIGSRKMGGMDFYSIQKEIAMGRQYAEQFEHTVKLVQDPVINEYVNRVGQNLVRNSDAKVPFTIKVIDDDSINAMALPGGFFYVNTGLILAADDESEMAGAMAHEIAHVAARHGTRGASRAQLANLMTIPLIFVGGPAGMIAGEAAGIGLPVTFLKFSRAFEAEADYLGIQYMYKSGYDPNGLIDIFEKIDALNKKKPGAMSKIFSDHPQTPDRIQKSQEEINTILPPRDQYIITTSEFNDVKSRLTKLENHRKVDDQDPEKPNLRRTAENGSPNSSSSSKKDDDRPVLHRTDH